MKTINLIILLFILPFGTSLFGQLGCTDPDAWNYNPNSTEDSGNCVYVTECEAGEGWYGLRAGTIGGALTGTTFTITTASFQDTLATHIYEWGSGFMGACFNLDSCYVIHVNYPIEPFNSVTFEIFGSNPLYGGNPNYNQMVWGVSDQESRITFTFSGNDCGTYGCMDPTALNYYPPATIDFNCMPCEGNTVKLSTDMFMGTSGGTSWSIFTDGEFTASGSFNMNQNDTNMTACIPDGCHELRFSGSNGWRFSHIYLEFPEGDTLASGWLSQGGQVRIPFGIDATDCEDPDEIYGCTNPLGENYSPSATVDDGSCDLTNSHCNISFNIAQDSITNEIDFLTNIYAEDYPIYLFWDFGDGTEVTEGYYPSHLYEGEGPFTVCVSLYTFIFFENEPMCYSTFCLELDPELFGLAPGEPFEVGIYPVSTRDQKDLSEYLLLAPNPASDRIRISSIPQNGSFESLRIIDMQGRVLMEKTLSGHLLSDYEMDVSSLVSGTYMILLSGDEGYAVKRFVKSN